jgi:hypothetical protein
MASFQNWNRILAIVACEVDSGIIDSSTLKFESIEVSKIKNNAF